MAKHIKALKCPQCGSVKKQQVKDDHYLCSNCNTEYFLDNDDINVNVKHTYNQPTPIKTNPKLILILVALFVGLTVILPLLVSLFSSKPSSKIAINATKNYRERITSFYGFSADNSDKPILSFVVERSSSGNNKEESFIRFYDVEEEKYVKDIPMLDWSETPNSIEYRTFSDGKTYMLAYEDNNIYELDKVNLDLKNISESFTSAYPALSSGLATVRFASENEGDGFRIMTNDGKELYFYPLAKNIYKDYAARRDASESIPADATESIYYAFSKKPHSYEEKIQLLKVWYKYKPGYPLALQFNPEWSWDARGNGIGRKQQDKNTYIKLFDASNQIVRFEDLTLDRLYFDPKVAVWDKEDLYITTKTNANPKSKEVLQKIDVNTGEVLWTYTPSEPAYEFYARRFYTYSNGVIFSYYNWGAPGRVHQLVVMDKNGKIVKNFDLDNFL